MTDECFVDGGLLETGNKLAVRQIAGIALKGLQAHRPDAETQRAALLHVATSLAAICNDIEPGKAMKGLPTGAAADAATAIATAAIHDDALGWLHGVLSAMAQGIPANEAFGWTGEKNRPRGNLELRNWLIQCEVHEAMQSNARPSWRMACAEVAGRAHLSTKSVEAIAKGITTDKRPAPPEDLFPVDPAAFRIGDWRVN